MQSLLPVPLMLLSDVVMHRIGLGSYGFILSALIAYAGSFLIIFSWEKTKKKYIFWAAYALGSVLVGYIAFQLVMGSFILTVEAP